MGERKGRGGLINFGAGLVLGSWRELGTIPHGSADRR